LLVFNLLTVLKNLKLNDRHTSSQTLNTFAVLPSKILTAENTKK